MPILLDHQLQGHIPHDILAFPVAFYCDELAALPNRAGPMHWHPCFEIATAQCPGLSSGTDPYDSGARGQRSICCILEAIFRNFDSLPKSEASRVHLNTQIRLQKMLTYIYENYAQTVTLADIAGAANISRSGAGRCFQSYLRCSPVEALIQYRLQTAQRLLQEASLTLQEIRFACGFHSVNYFSRQFRRR